MLSTQWETTKALGMMDCQKNFTCAFFKEIQSYLLDALNLSFTHGQLSNSQRQALITLIEKKVKTRGF